MREHHQHFPPSTTAWDVFATNGKSGALQSVVDQVRDGLQRLSLDMRCAYYQEVPIEAVIPPKGELVSFFRDVKPRRLLNCLPHHRPRHCPPDPQSLHRRHRLQLCRHLHKRAIPKTGPAMYCIQPQRDIDSWAANCLAGTINWREMASRKQSAFGMASEHLGANEYRFRSTVCS
ncbi:hypothetical protein EJ03DRAFT_327626 [Teratosphaeria nubilosa]|uniref:Uncharacterized protein n=1 Tax=Teratosphaeria nubilosa TaxID=161662 RepID=A0A6G1L8C5_9PEZI|nr:hypothetical protein EJ03DRAFT_327626 [Teratosphaeria nubilosa]